MRLRLGVLALLVAVFCALGGIAAVLNRQLAGPEAVRVPVTGSAPQYAPEVTAEPSPEWRREDAYLYAANVARVGERPYVDTPVPEWVTQEYEGHPDVPRILVIGDSFTWGHGIADLDTRWPVVLRDELLSLLGPARFEMVSVARSGASTYDEVKWISEVAPTLKPDLIIVGYVSNDPLSGAVTPEDCDSDACFQGVAETSEGLQQCLRDEIAVNLSSELLQRMSELRCDPVAIANELGTPLTTEVLEHGPSANPQYGVFLKSLERLRVAAAGVPVLVLPLPNEDFSWGQMEPYLADFTAAGFDVIGFSAAELDGIFRSGHVRTLDLRALPGNNHPGPSLTRFFARRAAPEVVARLEFPDEPASAPGSRSLVSSFLPADLRVDSSERSAELSYVPSGSGAPEQVVPCMSVGAPHARVMLDPARDSALRLSVGASESSPSLDVFVAGFDGEWARVIRSAGSVSPGGSLELVVEAGERGLLLVPQGASGCPVGSRLDLPPLQIRLDAL